MYFSSLRCFYEILECFKSKIELIPKTQPDEQFINIFISLPKLKLKRKTYKNSIEKKRYKKRKIEISSSSSKEVCNELTKTGT